MWTSFSSNPQQSSSSASGGGSGGGGGSHKKIIYFVRHAEAIHNVKEREAIQRAIAEGISSKEEHDLARRAVLQQDPSLKDAPLSADGTEQARHSGRRLSALFADQDESSSSSPSSSVTSSPYSTRRKRSNPVFRKPDVVLVSPLRRALMTATELFLDAQSTCDPPHFRAMEALREKRTGLACDERTSVSELQSQFSHVDFADLQRDDTIVVPEGEDNVAVRARAAKFLDEQLATIEGIYIAIVSHKGWLRELRHVLKQRVDSGLLRADFDLSEWDKKLYGNAEVRVAAFRWQDGALASVVSRSIDNAVAMMGDGFEFSLGPPSSGFSIFLAERTTKVHFISVAEGQHQVAVRNTAQGSNNVAEIEASLLPQDGIPASQHPLYDARLTRKGVRQAKALREMLAQRPSGGRPFTAFDLVIVSPLTRACEMADIIFGTSPGEYGGVPVPPPRILVREECRERFGRYVCDGRRTLTELMEEFPDFDFYDVPRNEDVLHGSEREPAVHCQERAMRLLEWLSARPERCVAVVTHSEFLRFLFGQFGDTLHQEDRSALQRMAPHCELRSVVLCSHGSIERQAQDAPPSTIRVPSCSSLSSLAEG